MNPHQALIEAAEEAEHALALMVAVNMQTRNDGQKLRELAECRIEAQRIISGFRAAISSAKAAEEGVAKRINCLGYPACDGDLVGEPHEEGCPMFSVREKEGL